MSTGGMVAAGARVLALYIVAERFIGAGRGWSVNVQLAPELPWPRLMLAYIFLSTVPAVALWFLAGVIGRWVVRNEGSSSVINEAGLYRILLSVTGLFLIVSELPELSMLLWTGVQLTEDIANAHLFRRQLSIQVIQVVIGVSLLLRASRTITLMHTVEGADIQ